MQDDGLTALHLAVWNGHLECVEGLCANDVGKNKEGVDESSINYRTCGGYTALHLAALGGLEPVKTISILVKAGADLSVKDRMERTAYEVAVACRNHAVMQALEESADIGDEVVQTFRAIMKQKHQLVLDKYSDEYRQLQSEEKNELFVERVGGWGWVDGGLLGIARALTETTGDLLTTREDRTE